jgi:hypothetical protein
MQQSHHKHAAGSSRRGPLSNRRLYKAEVDVDFVLELIKALADVDFMLELIKALAVEACKWAVLAIIGWFGFKLPAIRWSIAKTGLSRTTVLTVLAAVTISGFLNSAIAITYSHYVFARLSDWGGEPAGAPLSPTNINGGYGPITARGLESVPN